ncbi:MAG: T9SS type A sorting domain-containing protein [Bacteroidia bacterium]|nr:T9SS type A sorting domain-containing protein [Bacteroidia bacterium]
MKKAIILLAFCLPVFVFSQSLVSVTPDSASAGQTLTVTITGSGTNFNQSSSTVVIGSGVTVNNITVLSTTSIQASITVKSNAVTGNYDVQVGTFSSSYITLPSAFHINGIPPMKLDSISPVSANAGQTLEVTITGTNTHFGQVTNSVSFYFSQGTPTTIMADSVTAMSNTLLKAVLAIPVNAPTGSYSLDVTNSIDGVLHLTMFYINGVGNGAPALVSVSPDTAKSGQTINVTVVGKHTHFSIGSSTSVSFDGGIIVNSTTVLSDTLVQANITIPSNEITFNRHVTVTDSIDGSLSLYGRFHVDGINPPSLYSLNVISVTIGQTLNVTITGGFTHFKQAITTLSFSRSQGDSAIVFNSITFVNDTSIVANITIPKGASTGYHSLTVTNSMDGALTLMYALNVTATSGPSLISVNPSSANSGQTLSVTIEGLHTHFKQDSLTTVYFTGGITVNSTSAISDSALQCSITVPTNVYSGYYNVSISNSLDSSLVLYKAIYINGSSFPYLTSISPAGGKRGDTMNVTIIGHNTHFKQAAGLALHFTSNIISDTISVLSGTALSDTTISVNIYIPQGARIGTYKVTVYNSIDISTGTYFNVYDKCLSYFGTHYNSADNTFKLSLDSLSSQTGFSFIWNFGDGTSSALETPNHTFAKDTLYNVCLKITTPFGDTCSYCHIVGKDSIGNPVLKKAGGFSVIVVRYNGTVAVGVPENDVNGDDFLISIFPNPANERVSVSTKQTFALKNTFLSLYSIDGQLILQQPLNQDNIFIDTRGLAQGVYFIKVNNDDRSKMIKFAKY